MGQDRPEANDPLSTMFAGLAGDVGDPRALAKSLAGSTATVVSSSDTRAVYDVTLDPSALLGDAGSGALPSESMTARYTLDGDDRPITITIDAQGQRITVSFRDWGKPVSIHAPSAKQVGTLTVSGS